MSCWDNCTTAALPGTERREVIIRQTWLAMLTSQSAAIPGNSLNNGKNKYRCRGQVWHPPTRGYPRPFSSISCLQPTGSCTVGRHRILTSSTIRQVMLGTIFSRWPHYHNLESCYRAGSCQHPKDRGHETWPVFLVDQASKEYRAP